MKIAIIGLGFVGNSMFNVLSKKTDVIGYDKYKNIGNIEECLESDIVFLALPTTYNDRLGEYDKMAILETCDYLLKQQYNGTVVIKSTVEPETTNKLSTIYKELHFVHNPEFLTARTAEKDFENQQHIVLGRGYGCSEKNYQLLIDFYKEHFPNAEISQCNAFESESMKIYCNSFYAVKVQFFTELYLLCEKNKSDFNIISSMMLKNNWINPMHTKIPGPDGSISYGGLCFPKDTNALNKYMTKYNSDNMILDACIKERNKMRDDHMNCNNDEKALIVLNHL